MTPCVGWGCAPSWWVGVFSLEYGSKVSITQFPAPLLFPEVGGQVESTSLYSLSI